METPLHSRAIEPRIQSRRRFAAPHDGTHQTDGEILALLPIADVGVVGHGRRHDLGARPGHLERHRASNALDLLRWGAGRGDPRRLFDILHRDGAAGSAGRDIRQVDAQLACPLAHGRRRPWPGDRRTRLRIIAW
jgi:hypothetical protein